MLCVVERKIKAFEKNVNDISKVRITCCAKAEALLFFGFHYLKTLFLFLRRGGEKREKGEKKREGEKTEEVCPP